MVLTRSRIRAAVAAGALAAAAVVTGTVLATTAQAAETDDPRAVAFDGNATTCEDADLAGDIIDPADLTYTDGEINVDQSVTITGVPADVAVSGIVVKGGDAYNVYEPGLRELPADVPWEDLVAPINDGGQQPALSHWYVCGVTDEPSEPPSSEPTEPSEPTSSEPTEPSEPTESSEPTSEPTEPSEPTSSTPGKDTPSDEETSTTPETPAEEEDDDLALTGFGAAWLIPIGALLLIGGGAFVWLSRSRRNA